MSEVKASMTRRKLAFISGLMWLSGALMGISLAGYMAPAVAGFVAIFAASIVYTIVMVATQP